MSSPLCAAENMREGENEEMSSLQCALSESSFIKYAGYGPVEEMNFQTNIFDVKELFCFLVVEIYFWLIPQAIFLKLLS